MRSALFLIFCFISLDAENIQAVNEDIPAHTPYYLQQHQPKILSNTPKAPPTPRAHTPYYSTKPYHPPLLQPHPYGDTPPPQGSTPPYHLYPQPPMQTQHLDDMMTEPQPQRNPVEPNVNRLPGDESTLPDY